MVTRREIPTYVYRCELYPAPQMLAPIFPRDQWTYPLPFWAQFSETARDKAFIFKTYYTVAPP